MQVPRWLQFHWRTLFAGTAASAALLLAVVLVPQMLLRQANLQVLRNHVDEVARLAASTVDGDLHRQLLDGSADAATRERALAPLLRLHAAWPEVFYVYTMGVRDGKAFFVLDTAQNAELARRRGLRASQYMEPFVLRPEYDQNWLTELAAGRTVVNREFQYDDYGYFLTGHAPIRDSAGGFAGFVGVDFDLGYYLREDARFRRIEIGTVTLAMVLALLLGYGYARYRFSQQAELRLHRDYGMRDPLTGLWNRRGASLGIEAAWSDDSRHSHAALLVDIDNFKQINDRHGHATGDAVIRELAAALHDLLRPGDLTARLGGDEFLVFARDCDAAHAEQLAARLLHAVRTAQAPTPFTVSIGISVMTAADGGFDLLYRQADTALYRAKGQGRDRYSVFQ
jgi:diguanylate cyclase (GGDEF)-like protein